MNKKKVEEFFSTVTTFSGVGDPRTVKNVYFGMIKAISNELLRGNTASLPDFGEFRIMVKKEHQGRNIDTGESILKQATATLRFRPCRMMKMWCQNVKDRRKLT